MYLCMQMLLLDLFPQKDPVIEAKFASEARFQVFGINESTCSWYTKERESSTLRPLCHNGLLNTWPLCNYITASFMCDVYNYSFGRRYNNCNHDVCSFILAV